MKLPILFHGCHQKLVITSYINAGEILESTNSPIFVQHPIHTSHRKSLLQVHNELMSKQKNDTFLHHSSTSKAVLGRNRSVFC